MKIKTSVTSTVSHLFYFVIISRHKTVTFVSFFFSKINAPRLDHSFSSVVIFSLAELNLVLLFLRVWDVRSGRSIHKLKGHKVIMYTKKPVLLLNLKV